MKRLLTTSLLTIALAAIMPASAQWVSYDFALGIKGGMNRTNLSFGDADDLISSALDLKGGTGFFVGPARKFDLPPCFGVDAAVQYDQKRVSILDESVRLHSITIPVNVRLQFKLAQKLAIFAAAGPQVAFNVGNSDLTWGGTETDPDNRFQWKKSAFSINLGGGITLANHLELAFAYNIALGYTGEASFRKAWTAITSSDNDSKARSWALSAFVYL